MRPLPVADKGSNKSFVAVKIFELMKCDKNFGYCTADGRCLLQVICCTPPDLRSALLVKGGGTACGGRILWCRSFATRKNGTTSPCLRRNMLKYILMNVV